MGRFATTLLIFAIASLGSVSTARAAEKLEVGMAAPSFEAQTLKRQDISLDALRGKVVLLHFWASWCKGCLSKFPEFRAIYDEHGGRQDAAMANHRVLARDIEQLRSLRVLADSAIGSSALYRAYCVAEVLEAVGASDDELRQQVAGYKAPERELEWFLEQRRVHVRDLVGPSLAAGRIVLSDRYFLSTVAYQGARGLDAERLLAESEAEFPIPDLVLLLELDAETGLRRVSERGGTWEPVFEQQAFLERVAAIFRGLDRDYIAHLSAEGEIAEVQERVLSEVRRRLAL